jgi:hypothetical protein
MNKVVFSSDVVLTLSVTEIPLPFCLHIFMDVVSQVKPRKLSTFFCYVLYVPHMKSSIGQIGC